MARAAGQIFGPTSKGPRVKVCGLVRREDAEYAARAGASYVGSIFAGGPRAVDPAVARANGEAAAAAASGAGRFAPQRVAVVGAQNPANVTRIAREAGADIVQLHADPEPDGVLAMRLAWRGPVWAALRVAGPALPPHAAELFAVADAVVLDARVPGGALGGTGVALAWAELAGAVTEARAGTEAALVLAGGLTPENVVEAALALSPDVVDVSSGVEHAPGVKRHAAVLHFVSRAHAAYRDM